VSAPEPPAQEGIQATSPAGSKCCCPRGDLPPAGTRLLCYAAQAVFVCMVWGLCPCAFSSLSPLYRIFHAPHCPLFYIFSPAQTFPEPCKRVLWSPDCVVPTTCQWVCI
uniref:Uncharacterized protein n=1 Tax=Prolemur simus TaxID=1328070 RepID=A0A8C8ZUY2_PROSS